MLKAILHALLALILALVAGGRPVPGGSRAGRPKATNDGRGNVAVATFAAGCFWGVEETFRNVEGVTDTTVGYTGGHLENPSYHDVCRGDTGHAESVRVEYDPEVVSYEELLDVFWAAHNPTTSNQQGPDIGTQYRSAIFYHTPEQKEAAERSRRELGESGRYARPVVTRIEPAQTFWPAEDYHQQYYAKRRGACAL